MSLRIRRGLSTDIPTPVEGELLYTTDNGNLYVGFYDETQDAVIPKLTSASLVDDSSPTLSSNLDLNGNNIVGTGNINIDGTITATGSISLGDGVEDNVIVGGQIGSDLIPNMNNAYDIGTENVRWRNGYFEGIQVDGEITANSLLVTNISAPDSTSLYDGSNGELSVNAVTADTIDAASINGDIKGSVFGDDSTVLVDAIDGSLNTSELKIQFNTITSPVNLTVEASNVTLRGVDVDGGIGDAANFIARSVKFDNNTAIEPSPGDYIGGLGILSEFNDDFSERSIFITAIDSVTGSATSPAKQELWLHNAEGSLEKMLTVNSRGVTESTGPFKMPSYANDADRNAKIINPEAGMVIFNLRDDSTGVPQFQGYDGTTWVDLH